MSKDKKKIALLNDTLRRTFIGGRITQTRGVAALPEETREAVLTAVREFESFEPGDDPYGEHDFGAFTVDGTKFYWKIDYYDRTMEHGSEDPADPSQTTRVLTIMLADEY